MLAIEVSPSDADIVIAGLSDLKRAPLPMANGNGNGNVNANAAKANGGDDTADTNGSNGGEHKTNETTNGSTEGNAVDKWLASIDLAEYADVFR